MSEAQVFIPFPARLYAEFVLRAGPEVKVAGIVESVIGDFLDRTRFDDDIWTADYIARATEETAPETIEQVGHPQRGYQWQAVFLPNGTELRITYKGRQHHAQIKHEKLIYDNVALSPSEYASRVAGNTNRNAWRDIWLRLPNSHAWTFANDLRRGKQ